MTTTATVRALPRYNPATQQHSWIRDGHLCRWCGLDVHSVQADPNNPRSWHKTWVWWPGGPVFDNQHGGRLPRCPLPRGTRAQVTPGHFDAAGRHLPNHPATVACHWIGVWDPEDGPRAWYDLMFDDGRFRTVAADLVRALEGSQP